MGKQAARWAPGLTAGSHLRGPLRGRRASTPSTLPLHGRPGPTGTAPLPAFFTGMTGNENADRLLAMWRDADFADLTLTDIDEMFSKHMSAHKARKDARPSGP